MIALDIGNVLCRVNLQPFFDKVYNLLGWQKNRILSFCNAVHHDLGITDVIMDFKKEFGRDFSNETYQDLLNAWLKCVWIEDDMVDFMNKLVKTERVALLSNIGPDHAFLMRNKYSSFVNKCSQHFSCEVGARKPTKLFFQSFLLEYPGNEGILFIDDRIENLFMAQRLGFDARFFDLELCLKHKKSPVVALSKIIYGPCNYTWMASED